jgi:hypothetical protein
MKNKENSKPTMVPFENFNFSYKGAADDLIASMQAKKHAGNIVVMDKPKKEAGNIVFLERDRNLA